MFRFLMKMCITHLGFALLVLFAGVLHAQSTTQSCDAPRLEGGFFAPKQETYSNGARLSYTCNDGRQPPVSGWWATSTCQDGKWSHQPQCIESVRECSEPPKIPHAVVIHQEYQEVFAADSEVQYECEDGFTAEGAQKFIFCRNGTWTEGPTCRSSTSGSNGRPLPTTISHCGAHPTIPNAAVVEEQSMYLRYRCNAFYKLVGSDTVTCYLDGTWSQLPVCEDAFCRMDPADYTGYNFQLSQVEYIKEGESMLFPCTSSEDTVQSINVTCTNGSITVTRCRETRPGAGQPAGQGPSTSSGSRDTEPHFTTIKTCGGFPRVQYGEVAETNLMFLKYRCNSFYKREGPEIVRCYSNGTWSQPPTCKVNYCYLNTSAYSQLKPVGDIFIKEGEEMEVECVRRQRYWSDHYATVTCINGILLSTKCCGWTDRKLGLC